MSASPATAGDDVSAQALEQKVQEFLHVHCASHARVLLGLSGGMDSVVLLEILARLRPGLPIALSAMHVHHGLSEHADQWADFCHRVCVERGVDLRIEHVLVQRSGGESWEEQARLRRYECFARAGADAILLAHHQDDQCETFFLRLLRGSGARGLSAMAAQRALGAGSATQILRPLLSVSRSRLAAYAQTRELRWVDDDSNDNRRLARNFLRHEVLPLIESRFPAYRSALARAIADVRETDTRAARVTHQDMQGARRGNQLEVASLRSLGAARSLALLRAFLEEKGCRAPSRARLEELLRQILQAKSDAGVVAPFDDGALRRYRGMLYWVAKTQSPDPDFSVPWLGESSISLPTGLGTLGFSTARGAGVRQAHLLSGRCEIRFRRPGDALRLAAGRPRRSLKNLLNECAIPPWERASLPILSVDGTPVWVARVGYDSDALATHGESGQLIEWISASAT